MRPRRNRFIRGRPEFNDFRPFGRRGAEKIVLSLDEYEAIRLKDKEKLDQKECAEKMKISQPTFNRILKSAREKIADAIISGKGIIIENQQFNMGACKCICGYSQPKERGIPCATIPCPKCGKKLMRN